MTTGKQFKATDYTVQSGGRYKTDNDNANSLLGVMSAIFVPFANVVFDFAPGDVSSANDTVTETAHGLLEDDVLQFTTTGTLPTGLSLATNYHVIATGLTADIFKISASQGGAAVNLVDTGSGIHTATLTTGMTMRLAQGNIVVANAIPTNVAVAQTATITAPSTNPRKDIVTTDKATGAITVTTGAESGSPVDPSIPADGVPMARINLVVSQTSIENADIDDLRAFPFLGGGGTPDDASVAQGKLKTTTGDVSTASSTPVVITGPGGEYGFWPTVKNATTTSGLFICNPLGDGVAFLSIGTAFLQRITLQADNAETLTARQRYVQASPPYDLGDGEVAGFIFALIENGTGEAVAMYQAPEPPWALNGPTNITPDFIDSRGRKFKLIRESNAKLSEIIRDPTKQQEIINADRDGVRPIINTIEITPAFKNSDINLIPHPFLGNDLTGKTIVMLDPLSGFMERVMQLQENGETPLDVMFGAGFVKIDNVALTRGGPPGVDVVAAKLR